MDFDLVKVICFLAWLKPDWMLNWVAWLVPLIFFFAQYPKCLALVLGDKVKASIHDFSRLEAGPPRLSGRDLVAAGFHFASSRGFGNPKASDSAY